MMFLLNGYEEAYNKWPQSFQKKKINYQKEEAEPGHPEYYDK